MCSLQLYSRRNSSTCRMMMMSTRFESARKIKIKFFNKFIAMQEKSKFLIRLIFIYEEAVQSDLLNT